MAENIEKTETNAKTDETKTETTNNKKSFWQKFSMFFIGVGTTILTALAIIFHRKSKSKLSNYGTTIDGIGNNIQRAEDGITESNKTLDDLTESIKRSESRIDRGQQIIDEIRKGNE